jgi:hypothetical protein
LILLVASPSRVQSFQGDIIFDFPLSSQRVLQRFTNSVCIIKVLVLIYFIISINARKNMKLSIPVVGETWNSTHFKFASWVVCLQMKLDVVS